MHNALISGQIALTLLLLAGASGAIQGFRRLLHVPLGYDPHNVISVWIPLPENSYINWSGRTAYFEQIQATLGNVPGVKMAIATNATPPQPGWKVPFDVLGKSQLSQTTALVDMGSGTGVFRFAAYPAFGGTTHQTKQKTTMARPSTMIS